MNRLTNLWRDVIQSFQVLQRIQFDAPWRKTSGRAC
jgi:hypothetical protein